MKKYPMMFMNWRRWRQRTQKDTLHAQAPVQYAQCTMHYDFFFDPSRENATFQKLEGIFSFRQKSDCSWNNANSTVCLAPSRTGLCTRSTIKLLCVIPQNGLPCNASRDRKTRPLWSTTPPVRQYTQVYSTIISNSSYLVALHAQISLLPVG